MSGTNYVRKKILDDLTSVASYSPPALYLSLHTADPTAAGLHTFEIAGGSYARQALAGVMGAADATGFSVNTTVITFPTASADWGTVTYLGTEDAAAAGNMIWSGAPSLPRTITSGQPFQIPVGQLRLRLT